MKFEKWSIMWLLLVVSSEHIDDYCMTKECIKEAAAILDRLNETVDPCDDFYSFACGGFDQRMAIPEDKSGISQFDLISDEMIKNLHRILSKPVEDKATLWRGSQIARSYYQSCIDTDTLEAKGLQPAESIIKKLGGFPVADQGLIPTTPWYEILMRCKDVGITPTFFITFQVGADDRNSSVRHFSLDQTSLGLPREYLVKGLNDSGVKAYFEFMKSVAKLFGAQDATAEKDMMDVLNFEIKLANLTLPKEKRRNATALYNPMTIQDLQENYSLGDPSFNWSNFLNTFVQPEENLLLDDVVIVNVPKFFEDFGKLIKTVPLRTQTNYVVFRIVKSILSGLNRKSRDIHFELSKAIFGLKEQKPRWKTCTEDTTNSLNIEVGSLYVQHFFDEKSKATVLDMIEDLKTAFHELVEELDWMDEGTKKKAIEKSKAIVDMIGYPSEMIQQAKVDGFHDGLNFKDDEYLQNQLKLLRFDTGYSYSRLREPVNKTDWRDHANVAWVNAYYNPSENSINFPAAILQGVFFNRKRPQYLNYGSVAWVIGHELTHGFDDQGSQRDKDGNIADWWDTETAKKFKAKAQCIIDQYSNFTSPETGLKINGVATQGENIADNGGIKQAYRAYNSWSSRNPEERKLPGLNFTPHQMFWIGAANVWCNNLRPEALKQRILTNPHAPNQYRVLGTFSNMPEFARDFKCSSKAAMNPKDKCSVW